MKMLKITATTLVLILTLTGITTADDHVDLVREGNEAFDSGDYATAMEKYHSAEVEIPESPELFYNIAGAAFKQGDYEQAVDNYTKALNTTDIDLTAGAHYNLGNTHYRMGDYQSAITDYQKSLEINPDDLSAKFNLELARKMLKENSKPEQQNQDQEQQQQQQQPQEQQEGEQDQEQDQEQEEGEQDQQDEEQQQQQQQGQQEEQNEISKEDAERILNALRDDEQDLQKKIKRQLSAGVYRGKDW